MKPFISLEPVFIDNHLLVVNKPAGILSQADETGDEDMLTQGKAYLKERFNKPGNVYLGLVHRLDRPVSGVMVLARTSKAAGRLAEQFRSRTPVKKYLALVEGLCTGGGLQVDYLVKENRRVRCVSPDHPKAKRAELHWKALAYLDGISLIDLDLLTGRPHQIRVQLAGMGYPILGDLRYGARRFFDDRNLALHCYQLGIEHPIRREPMTWRVPPPATWNGFFDAQISALIAHPRQPETP
jgi:RluA family pseudouridine synthase